jgi:hypothetical protein
MSVSQPHTAERAACHAGSEVLFQEGRSSRRRQLSISSLRWPLAFGLLGALVLTAFYLGIVTAAESWSHALDLFQQDAYLVLPIILGFGAQVGLFVYLKRVLSPAAHAAGAGVLTGTSGGTSTLGMIACCAHHLTDVLPLVGLSGAAVFLAQYRVPFMVVGLASNAIGVGVLLITIRKAKRMASSEGGCH